MIAPPSVNQQITKGGGVKTPALSPPISQSNAPVIWETTEDMLEAPDLMKVLNFGDEECGKTHFGLTFPTPVMLIETENRAHKIIGKFKMCADCGKEFYTPVLICPKCQSKNITLKDIRRKRVRTIGDMYTAVDSAIQVLKHTQEQTGKIGTIMVDSFTTAWVEAQSEYIKETYAGNKDVKLNPRDDYKFINPRHNDLRTDIINAGFNVYFTATRGDIYDDPTDQFKKTDVKAEGQKHNKYAVDWLIYSHKENGSIKQELRKNSLTLREKVVFLVNGDYDKLQKRAEMFRDEEKMLTLEMLKKVNKEISTPEKTK